MLSFWFRYVNSAISLINAGKGEKYFISDISDKIHDFMGNVFEKICREFLLMKAGGDYFPFITEIDNFQKTVIGDDGKSKQIEIDLVGKDGSNILIIGECKFKKEKIGKETFVSFIQKAHCLKAKNPL